MALRYLAAAASILLLPTTSYGYALEGESWPTPSNVIFQVQLGALTKPLQDGSTSWNAAVAPVFNMWNQVVHEVHLNSVMNSTAAVGSGDGVNSIVFSSSIFGEAFGSSTLAVTYYSTQGSSMMEADVLFNQAKSFDSYRGALQFGSNGSAIPDIRRVLLHELGHALGLGHPDTAGQHVDAVMNSVISDRETLSSDDVAGAQSIYGAPAQNAPAQPDFNGDGNPDILFQNNSTGQRAVWLMDGTARIGGAYLPTVSPRWSIVGAADLNRDGKTDILFQNGSAVAAWLMNGLTYRSAVSLPSVPAQWSVAGTADFNGDGKPDILLQNNSTGQRAVWLMDGTARIGGAYLPTVSPRWSIVGAADLNRDGKIDIFFQNGTAVAAWLMNGLTYRSALPLPSLPTGWNVAGIADFNRDGKPDLFLQNNSTGQREIWLMDGTSHIDTASLPTVSPQWETRNH